MDDEPLLLSSLLPPQNIVIPLSAATKQGVVEELLDLLLSLRGGSRGGPGREEMLRLIWEREKLMSTGIGYGLAIPHTLCKDVDEPAAVLGLQPSGIDYAALDGKPATIVFLLISPESDTSPHIKILAHISRVFRHAPVRERLLACATAEEAATVIREAEIRYGRGEG